MLENFIVLFIVAFLVKTSNHRTSIGWLVLINYAIFILIDLEFFGLFQEQGLTHKLYLHWYISVTILNLLLSMCSSLICYNGNRIACIYSAILILNAVSAFSVALTDSDDELLYYMYNGLQNINLIIELTVVVLGTDNFLHKDARFGSIINSVNNTIDSCYIRIFNNSNQRS